MHHTALISIGTQRYEVTLEGSVVVALHRPTLHGGRVRTSLYAAVAIAREEGLSSGAVTAAIYGAVA